MRKEAKAVVNEIRPEVCIESEIEKKKAWEEWTRGERVRRREGEMRERERERERETAGVMHE